MSIQNTDQLFRALFPVVRNLVGQYVLPAGQPGGPAIVAGDPPGEVVGMGVEVRLPKDAPVSSTAYYAGELNWTGGIPVRVIGHNRASIEATVRAILRKYPGSSITYIPEDYASRIPSQAVITVPIH